MNTHLFLDLAKVPTKSRNIPFKHARVALFAPFKMAKKLITPDEPHAIYILPKKKTSNSVFMAAVEILSIHADAKIAMVSPRKKWLKISQKLQKRFPHAQIMLKTKINKKVHRFLKQSSIASINPADQVDPDDINIQAISEQIQQAVSSMMAPTQTDTPSKSPEIFTLLETAELTPHQPAIHLEPLLAILKKNRPKKKTDLIRLLSNTLKNQDPQHILEALQREKMISIDVAENVRYH